MENSLKTGSLFALNKYNFIKNRVTNLFLLGVLRNCKVQFGSICTTLSILDIPCIKNRGKTGNPGY